MMLSTTSRQKQIPSSLLTLMDSEDPLAGFRVAPHKEEDFLSLIYECVDKIKKCISHREALVDALSRESLLLWAARTIFVRAYWQEVIMNEKGSTDCPNRIGRVSAKGQKWLRENGMSSSWWSKLLSS
jgi:hypothetical protein